MKESLALYGYEMLNESSINDGFDRYRRNLAAFADKYNISKKEARMNSTFKYCHRLYKKLAAKEYKSKNEWIAFEKTMIVLGVK